MKLKLILSAVLAVSIASAQVITTVNGWKLVGAKEGINPVDSFSDSGVQSVWTYNETNKNWNLFSKNHDVSTIVGIDELTYIDDGVGFWILANDQLTIDTGTGESNNIIDKNYLIGETFYYIDKTPFTKIYEANMTIAMELNSSIENNNTYYPHYELHSLYFGDDYLKFDTNQTFQYLSFDDNTLKIYSETLKDSRLHINGFSNGTDLDVTLDFNVENPQDNNITQNLNGTFNFSSEHISHFVQPLNTHDINGTSYIVPNIQASSMMYMSGMYSDIVSSELNGTWPTIPTVEVNATYSAGGNIHLVAQKSSNIINLFDHNSSTIGNVTLPKPQGVSIQLFAYNKLAKIERIYFSESEKVLAVSLSYNDPMYYYMMSSSEYMFLDISDPFKPSKLSVDPADFNTTYSDMKEVF